VESESVLHRGISGHVETYQCVVHDEQEPKTIAWKMSNLRLAKKDELS